MLATTPATTLPSADEQNMKTPKRMTSSMPYTLQQRRRYTIAFDTCNYKLIRYRSILLKESVPGFYWIYNIVWAEIGAKSGMKGGCLGAEMGMTGRGFGAEFVAKTSGLGRRNRS
ncbi:hypothetical protein Tco_0749670 [Tanacetum coccineum]|uniref:Uncharacterized protein n=1 Tax=Tanacetum coccineum TaxID=301880 RepID=A0ABQ4YZ53_9ASTR